MSWSDGDTTQQPPGVTKIEYYYPSVEEQLKDENSLLHYCRKLNYLKLAVPSIARGKNEFVYSAGDLCVMKRTWKEEESYLVINFSSSKTVEYELAVEGLSLAGILDAGENPSQTEVEQKCAKIVLSPYAIAVFTK